MKSYLKFLLPGLLALSWWWLAFAPFKPFSSIDWQQHQSFREIERKILFDYNEIPLWNPWLCGGEMIFGHPHFEFPYPTFLLTGVAGTFLGSLLMVLASVYVFILGLGRFAEAVGVRFWPAFFLQIAGLNIFVIYAWGGALDYMAVCWAPWLAKAYFDNNYQGSPLRRGIEVGLYLSLFAIAGAVYMGAAMGLALALGAVIEALRLRSFRPLIVLSIAVAICFAAAAVRFLPLFDLLKLAERPAYRVTQSGLLQWERWPYFVAALKSMFFSEPGIDRNLAIFSAAGAWIIKYRLAAGTLAALTVSIFFGLRSRFVFAAITLLLLLLSAAETAPINFWTALQHVFPFKMMEHPNKMLGALILFGLLAAAIGLSKIYDKYPAQRFFNALVFLLLLIEAHNVVRQTQALQQYREPLQANLGQAGQFKQTREPLHAAVHRQALNVQNNIGTIACYDSLGMHIRSTVAAIGEPNYRGEVYLAGEAGSARIVEWRPSWLKIEYNAASDDILIVNQNHWPGWQAHDQNDRQLNVNNYSGLIGVAVPAASAATVTLAFKNKMPQWGGLLSALTWGMSLLFLVRTRRRPAADATKEGA